MELRRGLRARSRRPAMLVALFATGLVSLVGCMNGRTMELRNPFESAPPAYKTQYGLAPAQKVDRLRVLTDQVARMDATQQSNVCQELITTLKKERDPILRRELVKALGAVPLPQAAEGLHFAAEDDYTQVRIAACEAWGRRNDPQASGALAAILAEDGDVDVRLAASEALARRPQGESIPHLAATLEDRDPAVQLATMEALRNATGADIRDDVNEWLAFLNARSPVNPVSPSINTPGNGGFPEYPADEARLASGVQSSPIVKPPVYEDVSSGEPLFR